MGLLFRRIIGTFPDLLAFIPEQFFPTDIGSKHVKGKRVSAMNFDMNERHLPF